MHSMLASVWPSVLGRTPKDSTAFDTVGVSISLNFASVSPDSVIYRLLMRKGAAPAAPRAPLMGLKDMKILRRPDYTIARAMRIAAGAGFRILT